MKTGDDLAAERLWQRYFDRLTRLAQRRLEGAPQRLADEEDVALEAFAAFCRAAKEGRFPKLADRHGLWRVLLKITADKAIDQIRRESAQMRGNGIVHNESDMGDAEGAERLTGIDQIVGDDPTPEFAATVAENCRRLLELLDDPALRAVALAKLEGYTNQEIALQQDCALRSVERRLNLIRKKWLLAVQS